MAEMTVRWRHEPLAHDAGRRAQDEVDFNTDAARTGILTDEHQEVEDGLPVLVEHETGRVYRAADLPPDTVVAVAAVGDPPQPIVQNARAAGFHVVSAANGRPIPG